MSDTLRLYQAISKLINDVLPDMLEANRITLAQMITGIFRSQNVADHRDQIGVNRPKQSDARGDITLSG